LKKIFIKSPYHKRKKDKKNIPTPFLQPPHPTPPKEYFLGNFFKIPPSYLEKQPNFSLPCHPRNKHLG